MAPPIALNPQCDPVPQTNPHFGRGKLSPPPPRNPHPHVASQQTTGRFYTRTYAHVLHPPPPPLASATSLSVLHFYQGLLYPHPRSSITTPPFFNTLRHVHSREILRLFSLFNFTCINTEYSVLVIINI